MNSLVAFVLFTLLAVVITLVVLLVLVPMIFGIGQRLLRIAGKFINWWWDFWLLD